MNTGMLHSRASSVQRSIMYTAPAPCLCGMEAVCSVFQEMGRSFSNQMYTRSLRKVVRQLMGRNSLRPLGCGFLGMRDAMTRNHVSWKLSEENIPCMFLARHTICSSGNARSISAVTPSRLDLPFFNLAKHCQTSRGETSISWAPLSNARHHSRIRSFLAFNCNPRSAGTVISKMSAQKLLMADDGGSCPKTLSQLK